jgi:hypothetical protein
LPDRNFFSKYFGIRLKSAGIAVFSGSAGTPKRLFEVRLSGPSAEKALFL